MLAELRWQHEPDRLVVGVEQDQERGALDRGALRWCGPRGARSPRRPRFRGTGYPLPSPCGASLARWPPSIRGRGSSTRVTGTNCWRGSRRCGVLAVSGADALGARVHLPILCGTVDGGWWQMADGLRRCRGCRSESSVTAGTIFAGTRSPLVSWFAAIWYVVNQKQGVSALGLQRVHLLRNSTSPTRAPS